MMQQRRVALQHAERMSDNKDFAWRHMAIVAKQMHHWPEKPTGEEMDKLVDAYAGQYTQSQLENDAMPQSTNAEPSLPNSSFDASQSHPSTLGDNSTTSYPVPNASNAESMAEPTEIIGDPTETIAQPMAQSNTQKTVAQLQSMFQKFKLDREKMISPKQAPIESETNDVVAQSSTGAKMHHASTHSHSPYSSARTQGLFSSGHVKESDSITELQLTMLNLQNRLDVIRASSGFDPKHPEVVQAQLLVQQSEMP